MRRVLNFLIIATKPGVFAVQELQKSIEKAGHLAIISSPDNLEEVNLKNAHILINRNTALNYQDNDLHELDSLIDLNKQILVNSTKCTFILRDKWRQWEFHKETLHAKAVIETYPLRQWQRAKEKFKNQKSWIIKTLRGQQARGVYGSTSLAQDAQKLMASGDYDYIIQPYFPFINEWRILVIKSKARASIKKFYIQKSPLNNKNEIQILNFASSKTRLVKDNIPKNVTDIGDAIIESSLDFFFISIDILENAAGETKLLEINNCPGIQGAMGLLSNVNEQTNLADIIINELILDYEALL